MTQVVSAALYLLASSETETYVPKKISKLACSLYVSPLDRKVFILLGKRALDYTNNEEAKTATAVELYSSENALLINQCILSFQKKFPFTKESLLAGKRLGQFSAVIERSSTKLRYIAPQLVCRFLDIKAQTTYTFYDVAKKLAMAIKGLHDQHIVHNNISPGAMYLTSAGDIYFRDLSLAYKPQTEPPKGLTPLAYGNTKYAPPESLERGRELPLSLKAGRDADTFAFGCALYLYLTGKEIPWGSDMQQLWHYKAKVKSRIQASIKAVQLQKNLDPLVQKLLLPADKRISIAAFLNELQKEQIKPSPKVEEDTPPDQRAPKPIPTCKLFGLPDNCSVCMEVDEWLT